LGSLHREGELLGRDGLTARVAGQAADRHVAIADCLDLLDAIFGAKSKQWTIPSRLSAGSNVASRAHTFTHTFESASSEFWRYAAEHRSQLVAENPYKSAPNEHQRSIAKAFANGVGPAPLSVCRRLTPQRAFFVETGIVSLMTLSSGSMLETAMVGCHGAVGASVALGATTSMHRSIVSVPGNAFRIRVDDLQQSMDERPQIR
jgi:hypothetical protein